MHWERIVPRLLLVWLIIIAVETVHGIARGIFLVPQFGDLASRQIGVLIGSLLIFLITFVFVRWIGAEGVIQYLCVGLAWVLLTLCFEIVLGRYVLDVTWERILSDYQVSRGGFMIFGLLFMLFSPYLAGKLRLAMIS